MKKLQQKCKIYYKIQQKLWLKKEKKPKKFFKNCKQGFKQIK